MPPRPSSPRMRNPGATNGPSNSGSRRARPASRGRPSPIHRPFGGAEHLVQVNLAPEPLGKSGEPPAQLLGRRRLAPLLAQQVFAVDQLEGRLVVVDQAGVLRQVGLGRHPLALRHRRTWSLQIRSSSSSRPASRRPIKTESRLAGHDRNPGRAARPDGSPFAGPGPASPSRPSVECFMASFSVRLGPRRSGNRPRGSGSRILLIHCRPPPWRTRNA